MPQSVRSGRRSGTIRVVGLVLVHGGAAAFCAFEIGRSAGGMLAAGSMLLSVFLVAVTLGGAIGVAVNGGLEAWEDRRTDPPAGPSQLCGCCGRPLTTLGSASVCPSCDYLPLRKTAGRPESV